MTRVLCVQIHALPPYWRRSRNVSRCRRLYSACGAGTRAPRPLLRTPLSTGLLGASIQRVQSSPFPVMRTFDATGCCCETCEVVG